MSVTSKINSGPAIKMISEKAKKRLLAIGFSIEREAKLSCTEQGIVDTGRLRASISTNWTDSGLDRGKTSSYTGGTKNEYGKQMEKVDSVSDGIGAPQEQGDRFEVVVGSNVYYAPFHEFGTSKMGARPFMRPAFEKYKGIISATRTGVYKGKSITEEM
jgi:HK97 gp10 family phage protein